MDHTGGQVRGQRDVEAPEEIVGSRHLRAHFAALQRLRAACLLNDDRPEVGVGRLEVGRILQASKEGVSTTHCDLE
eukprot:2117859-Rhodomonas_salina.1